MMKQSFLSNVLFASASGVLALASPISAFAQSANTEAAVQSSPKVTTQQHGDWLLECYDPAVNGISCQIKQRVVHNESGQNILMMTLAHNPKDKSDIVQYVLPLDFLLGPGVGVNVGDYQSVARVNRCTAQGCIVEGKTEDGFINAMKVATDQGRFVMMSRAGKKVAINFSATGFTKAYNEMLAQNSK
ncbi:invasion associated locus B family protein [Pseudovibrio sp. Tun.PSC04-5.I4]|uniref:invasion associated locus B family protein n=1 Tax=Pseudovibrio sp. Tun.PSC04-5.I4 TaxID=1798213 RepID=UPI00087ECF40|nr:invasion associated locus B family protein [Pseudovibrio sp. Tun.PSC04-5.I4]SDR48187.1 Invasion protein IalB, involved in pathogenesis [Pseudovibrio sp. Tun.PSC04-5.I4]